MRKNLAFIILTAGALLALFLLTIYIHQTNRGQVLSQFNEYQLEIARQTARQIESYLRSRSRDLQRLSSSASRQNSGRARISAEIQSDYERIKAIKISDISLLDDQGTVVYSTTAVARGANHSRDNFFSWAREPVNKGAVWIGYEKADGRRIPVSAGSLASPHIGIFLVTPLYRESTAGGRQKPVGKFDGALMFKVDLEGMLAEQSIVFTPLMKLHKLWIMDRDGTVLMQSEHPEMVMRSIREKDDACHQCHASFNHVEMMLGKVEGITEYQLKGTPKKVAAFTSMSVENASWVVVANAPLDDVTAFVWEDLKKTLLLLGILVFILGIAFFWAYRNYREKVDHATTINTLLGISLLNIHLEEQLDKMLEIIISIPWLKVEAKGCILLVKEKSDVLVMVAQKGLDPSLMTLCAEVPLGHCLCGRAARTGKIEFADSADERHDNQYEAVSPHGHYCVPIQRHDKVLGVLNLYLKAGHRRDKMEEEFLKAITDIMAGIVEQKRAEKQLQETLESLRKAVGTTIQVMVSAVETRDPYTSGHQTRSADLARAIAVEMGLPQEKIDAIRMAGSIHDIGKLSIPAEILSKPTKLSEIEFSLIKEHSRKGFEMLKDVKSPWPLAEIILQHHERMDGSGYPRKLKGDEILIEARILTVADVVEAMASHRPYRPGLGIDPALSEIEKNRGIFYDNAVADACLRLFREKGFKLEEHDYKR